MSNRMDAAGEALNAISQTMQAGAQVAQQIGAPIAQNRRNTQYAKALTETQREFYEFQREIQDVTDPEEYATRFEQAQGRIHENVVNNIQMDAQARDRFENEFLNIAESNRQTTMQMAENRQRAQDMVGLQESLDRAKDFPDPDEANRHVQGLLMNAYEDGIIQEQELYELEQQYDGLILFNAARSEADAIIDDFGGEDGHNRALEFARDPDNGLNPEQQQNLVGYIRDRRQDFDRARQEQERAFDLQADELFVSGHLTFDFINNREQFEHVSHQSRQYWRDMLNDMYAASEGGSDGRSRTQISDSRRSSLMDKIREGRDWTLIYNEARKLRDQGVLTGGHYENVVDALETDHNDFPLHGVRETFDDRVDELEDISNAEVTRAWRHLRSTLNEQMFITDDQGRTQVNPEAPTNEEMQTLADQILVPLEIDNIRQSHFQSFNVGLRTRDGQEATRQIDAGKFRYRRGFDPDVDQMIDDVATGHRQLLENVTGTQGIQHERIDSDGAANFLFRFDENDRLVPLTESEMNNIGPGQEVIRGRIGWDEENGDMALRLQDGSGGWSVVVDPDMLESELAEDVVSDIEPQEEPEFTPEPEQSRPNPEQESLEQNINDLAFMEMEGDRIEQARQIAGKLSEGQQTIDNNFRNFMFDEVRVRTGLTTPEIRVALSQVQGLGIEASEQDIRSVNEFHEEVETHMPQIERRLEELDNERGMFSFRNRRRVTEWIDQIANELNVSTAVVVRAYRDNRLYESWGVEPRTR